MGGGAAGGAPWLTSSRRAPKMGFREIDVRPFAGPNPGAVSFNLRADTACSTTRAAVIAADGEFFGGIWFKIFSERGPSRVSPTP